MDGGWSGTRDGLLPRSSAAPEHDRLCRGREAGGAGPEGKVPLERARRPGSGGRASFGDRDAHATGSTATPCTRWQADGAPGHGSDECGRHEEDGVQRPNRCLRAGGDEGGGAPSLAARRPRARGASAAPRLTARRKRLKAEERARRDKLREVGTRRPCTGTTSCRRAYPHPTHCPPALPAPRLRSDLSRVTTVPRDTAKDRSASGFEGGRRSCRPWGRAHTWSRVECVETSSQ